MKRKSSLHILSALLLIWTLILASQSARAEKPVLVVDDDKVECPNAGFMRIQDAVDAASSGAVIRICKGNYVEQVTINKSVTLDADSGAALLSASMQPNATSLVGGTPLAAAIVVADATNVAIRGLILDGANNGLSECSPRLFGVVLQNASGTLSRLAVRNFKLAANLSGCQSGSGILVQSGGGQISKVEIENCTIHDFQKNGITANEIGTEMAIHDNVVTGIGPTAGAAQNGIQIGFGAGGSISRNTVANNLWSPCVTVDSCPAVATNILVEQSDSVSVSQNRVGIGQISIFVHGNLGSVDGNETFASSVFDGIRVEGSQNQLRRNDVFSAAEAGIFVDGDNNVVEHNTITEAGTGILKTSGSNGNLIRSNDIFATPVQIQDPPVRAIANVISPLR